MRSVRSSEGVDFKHLIAGFKWQDILDGGVVVDVGFPPSPSLLVPIHILNLVTVRLGDQPEAQL